MKRNPFFSSLSNKYLFQEIQSRVTAFQKAHPDKRVLSLGIGDTTQPIAPSVVKRLVRASEELGDTKTYTGYGPGTGLQELREKIADITYSKALSDDEIFVSDGIKNDLLRVLLLFEDGVPIAIQDPSYPVYFDAATIAKSAKATLLPSIGGDVDLSKAPRESVVFLCSPNNPTGEAFTRSQYEKMISVSIERNLFIVLDAAYREFIRGDYPKSIYEVDGAKKVAIEVGSFSKAAGFSGVRLGWTVIPKELSYSDGKSVHSDFHRIFTSVFNGASILSQKGALQILTPEGQQEISLQIASYMGQTQLLRAALVKKGFSVLGGKEAPYIWVKTERSSWDSFDYFLNEMGIVVTPGIGFGPGGEGFIRFSGLAQPEVIAEAIERISFL